MALKFAISYPEYVKQLVLLSPGGIAAVKISYVFRSIYFALQGDAGIQKLVHSFSHPQSIHPETEKFLLLVFRHFRMRTSPQPIFSDKQLRQLNMPVLFIGGAVDAILPAEKSARRLGALLPNVTVKIIPDANHALINNLQSEIIPFLTCRH